MLIQIHLLQNYAPSNLNRDQSGSPKDAVFGGRKRGRISSQCLKRSMRWSSVFQEEFKDAGLLGARTQQLPTLIKTALASLDASDEEINAIVTRAPEIGRESTKGKQEEGDEEETPDDGGEETVTGETKQLIFLDVANELPRLAANLLTQCRKFGVKDFANPKKVKIGDITRALGSSVPRSVDIALFGRMTTSEAFQDVQAASQVAHAISTHAVEQEFDYYTAMDDLKPDGQPGADMIGDIEFNSCTYYKYLNVHWEGLLDNLGLDNTDNDRSVARQVVSALLAAAAFAHPSGKQNSMAAFSMPDLILVEVSDKNVPVSYANAFLRPVRAYGDRSLMEVSIEQLEHHVQHVARAYNLKNERAFLSVDERQFMGLQGQESLDDLREWLTSRLPA